jgi:hypothetical protein
MTANQRRPRGAISKSLVCLNDARIYNLRKIQAVIADSVEDQILKFIYYPKQVLTKRCHLGALWKLY